jgi:hypothetical protein
MENVVKHNIISMEHPLTVYLKEEDDRLIFKNKITLRNQSEKTIWFGTEQYSGKIQTSKFQVGDHPKRRWFFSSISLHY